VHQQLAVPAPFPPAMPLAMRSAGRTSASAETLNVQWTVLAWRRTSQLQRRPVQHAPGTLEALATLAAAQQVGLPYVRMASASAARVSVQRKVLV